MLSTINTVDTTVHNSTYVRIDNLEVLPGQCSIIAFMVVLVYRLVPIFVETLTLKICTV